MISGRPNRFYDWCLMTTCQICSQMRSFTDYYREVESRLTPRVCTHMELNREKEEFPKQLRVSITNHDPGRPNPRIERRAFQQSLRLARSPLSGRESAGRITSLSRYTAA